MSKAGQQPADQAAWAGARLYSSFYLKGYDLYVHRIFGPLVWKCPPAPMLAHYNQFVSANHLDVGVGTGYMLDRCQFPTTNPRLVLMDLNPAPLAASKQRVKRYQPLTLQRNVLEPIEFSGEGFDSIGMNYLIHCVPGTIPQKAVMFDHLGKLLKPKGVIFGTTVLGDGPEFSWLSRFLLHRMNQAQVFSNLRDNVHDLRRALEDRFTDVDIRMVGTAALFSARQRST